MVWEPRGCSQLREKLTLYGFSKPLLRLTLKNMSTFKRGAAILPVPEGLAEVSVRTLGDFTGL